MFHLLPARPEQLINVGAWADIDANTRSDIQRAAEKALSRPIPALRASDWIHDHETYTALKNERRSQLFALLMGAVCQGSERYIQKIIDLVWEICFEGTWRDAFRLDKFRAGDTDLAALETASLLAWTMQLVGNDIMRISEDIYHLIGDVLARRVFTPFVARETPEWALRKDGLRLSKLSALLSALLLGDENDRRRWLGIRRCLMLMDDALRELPADGVHPYGLEAWLPDAEALSDAATMILMATGGEVDVRSDRKFLRLADYPVNAHMANGCFLNPDGETQPALSGETLFRIGECADNPALKRLGAAIGESGGEEGCVRAASGVLKTLMRRAFLAEAAVYPVRAKVFLPGSMLACAEASQFRAGLTGGSFTRGHADAGNLHLYYAGRPVFTDLDSSLFQASLHSMPCVNGFEVMKGFGGAKDIEARFEDAFTYLSINLAPGFDELAGVVSWQRTVMLSPMEKRVRIIEAFDLKAPAEKILFRFATPWQPEKNGDSAYILGNVRLAWEGKLKSKAEKVRGGWQITVEAPPGGMRGNYAFVVSPRQA